MGILAFIHVNTTSSAQSMGKITLMHDKKGNRNTSGMFTHSNTQTHTLYPRQILVC